MGQTRREPTGYQSYSSRLTGFNVIHVEIYLGDANFRESFPWAKCDESDLFCQSNRTIFPLKMVRVSRFDLDTDVNYNAANLHRVSQRVWHWSLLISSSFVQKFVRMFFYHFSKSSFRNGIDGNNHRVQFNEVRVMVLAPIDWAFTPLSSNSNLIWRSEEPQMKHNSDRKQRIYRYNVA